MGRTLHPRQWAAMGPAKLHGNHTGPEMKFFTNGAGSHVLGRAAYRDGACHQGPVIDERDRGNHLVPSKRQ